MLSNVVWWLCGLACSSNHVVWRICGLLRNDSGVVWWMCGPPHSGSHAAWRVRLISSHTLSARSHV